MNTTLSFRLRIVAGTALLPLASLAPAQTPPVPTNMSDGEIRVFSAIHREARGHEFIDVGSDSPLSVYYRIEPLGDEPADRIYTYYYRNSLTVKFRFFWKPWTTDLDEIYGAFLADWAEDVAYNPGGYWRLNVMCTDGYDDPLAGDGINHSTGFAQSSVVMPGGDGLNLQAFAKSTFLPPGPEFRTVFEHAGCDHGPYSGGYLKPIQNIFPLAVSPTTVEGVYICEAQVATSELSVEHATSIADIVDGDILHATKAIQGMPLDVWCHPSKKFDPLDIYDIFKNFRDWLGYVKTYSSTSQIFEGAIGWTANGTMLIPSEAFVGATSIAISVPGFTRYTGSISAITDTNGDLAFALFAGDLDGSNEIDAGDVDAVIADYGLTPEDANWLSTGPNDAPGFYADIDKSGEVDAADADIVIANYGETGN